MKEIQLHTNDKLTTAYEYEDVAFCNTSLFTETSRYFTKHGVYTHAPNGTLDHKDFWDREENRILNGITVPGKLLPDGSIQKVHITGEHYSYLNYTRIKLTKDKEASTEQLIAAKKQESKARKKIETFPAFWDGDYHYFKARALARELGLHMVVSKGRRKGYSYKNGSVVSRTATFVPKSVTILGAYDKKYLTQKGAITTMAKTGLDWFQLHTDFNRGWLKETMEDLQLGYRRQGSQMNHGYQSGVLSLSFMDNPDAAIGKDAEEIIFEEAGNFPNLLDALDVTMSTMEDGDFTTGMITVFGTGGVKEGNYAAFESIFYEPESYGFMPFHNIFDDEATGSVCGFFHGQQQNFAPYLDKDGNSDIKGALESIEKDRILKKTKTTNPQVYNRYVAQRCIKPSEAFGGTNVSIFDSQELRDHISIVEHNPFYKNLRRDGKLEETAIGIKYLDNSVLPYKDKHNYLDGKKSLDNDLTGCYSEWFRPYRDANGNIPSGLYRVWNDPYAFEIEQGEITIADSLGSTYVYERPNNFTPTKGDCIVACYVGRPSNPDDYNQQLLNITKYWNAICQFERDRGDVRNYFKRAGAWNLLADSPDFDWKRELQGKRTVDKGIVLSHGSDRKGNAAIILKQWLYTKRGFDEETKKIVYNLHNIYDLGLLRELSKWHLKGNFDRVSSFLIGMLDKNEISHTAIKNEETKAKNGFFTRLQKGQFY